jgi:hypothetical protein
MSGSVTGSIGGSQAIQDPASGQPDQGSSLSWAQLLSVITLKEAVSRRAVSMIMANRAMFLLFFLFVLMVISPFSFD